MNNDIPDARVSDNEGSASDEDGVEFAAAESDEEIVHETLRQSPMKDSTRSKSQRYLYLNHYYSPTLRTKKIDHSPANVTVPVQLR